ncbi:MAG: DUF167 domain-containing protein [Phycisphaeraceae bacterium]
MPELDDIQAAIAPDSADAVTLRVKVVPGASRSRLAGMLGDRLKVQIAAPPEGGKANKALCTLLAKTLGINKTDVHVTTGASQPHKTVTITNLTPQQLTARLQRALAPKT